MSAHQSITPQEETHLFNIFAAVKDAVSVPQAAAYYGMKINRSNMTCCLSHDDHHPSMKLNPTYFYCFSCHASGDVIDFVALLFHEGKYDAAKRLATDFHIGPNTPTPAIANPVPRRMPDEALCLSVLTDYEQLLRRWKEEYAPTDPDNPLDDRFVEACQMLDSITAMTNILFMPDRELRASLVRKVMADGTITKLKERLDRLKEGDSHEEPRCAA